MYKHSYLDHRDLLLALNQFANIRYAAYRTAAKLKFIQKHTKLDCVKLSQVFHTIEKSGLRSSEKELVLTNLEVKHLVSDIFELAQKDVLIHLDHKVSAKIATDLLKETFNCSGKRNGCSLLNFLVFFTILCGETILGEKYRKLLQVISDHNRCIQRRNLAMLLKSISSLAHLVKEGPAFGNWTILAAVQQCFEKFDGNQGVPEDVVFGWLVLEPQSLVWWSTLYRINAASKVIHPVRCSVCNNQPIQGLRYQCLECLMYNQCQQCFWLGLVSKGHKVTHEMQEYCTKTTSKEATQALWKKMGNWLTLKKNRCPASRYLPLDKGRDFKSSDTLLSVIDDTRNTTAEVTVKYHKSVEPELASVVGHIMEEKGKLEDVFQQTATENSLGPVVKEHCDQLEVQLRRLRQLVTLKESMPSLEKTETTGTGTAPGTVSAVPKRFLTRLESTPLLPSQYRKNPLEHFGSFSPIDEPKRSGGSARSARERMSLRPGKANIVTNGTLNYCTPRMGRRTESASEVPRFTTDFSLRDLSRNLQQQSSVSSTLEAKSTPNQTFADSELNWELEDILAQLEQLFPSEDNSSKTSGRPMENITLVRGANQVAGVMAEFVDAFKE